MSEKASLPSYKEVAGLKIDKIKLGNLSEVMQKLQGIPEILNEVQKLGTQDKIMGALPRLISKFLPDVIEVICISTREDKSKIEELDLVDAIECIKAIIDLNDFLGVGGAIQSLLQTVNKKVVKSGSKT